MQPVVRLWRGGVGRALYTCRLVERESGLSVGGVTLSSDWSVRCAVRSGVAAARQGRERVGQRAAVGGQARPVDHLSVRVPMQARLAAGGRSDESGGELRALIESGVPSCPGGTTAARTRCGSRLTLRCPPGRAPSPWPGRFQFGLVRGEAIFFFFLCLGSRCVRGEGVGRCVGRPG